MKFLNKKTLILLPVVFLLVACGVKYGNDGKVLSEFVISLHTPFSEVLKTSGLIGAIITWPFAILINYLAQYMETGWAVIIATVLINLVIAPLNVNTQKNTQKMQLLQPEIAKINKKYEGSNPKDMYIQQRKAQEINAVYAKHNVSPFSSMLVMIIQFPIFIGMYQAAIRSAAVAEHGTFFSFAISEKLSQFLLNFSNFNFLFYLVLFLINIGLSYVVFKLPFYLAQKRKNGRVKAYKMEGMPSNNTLALMMVAFTGFFSLALPVAMTIYWIAGTFIRILITIYIDKKYLSKGTV